MLVSSKSTARPRRGVVLVMAALLIIVVFAMAAMAIDVGYMMLMKTQLQAAADAGALAAGNLLHKSPGEIVGVGREYITHHRAGGRAIRTDEASLEIGVWDAGSRTFTPTGGQGNAVRATARRDGESLFFAHLIGTRNFSTEASAIAIASAKDIAFVIDLSGSMNDDTEPAWATSSINTQFSGTPSASIGNRLMQEVYDDFRYGAFPGELEYLGAPVGAPRDRMAYAVMTGDRGPLSTPDTPPDYRVGAGQSEITRKQQAYNWIIDNQLRRLLPNARPEPSLANYAYWEKYLDYVLLGSPLNNPSSGGGGGGNPGGGGPRPPAGMLPTLGRSGLLNPAVAGLPIALQAYGDDDDDGAPWMPRVGGHNSSVPVWLPPDKDGDRIDKFNNPNKSSFPSADRQLPWRLKNYLGKLTYVQFLMDHGRDLAPAGDTPVELSHEGGLAPLHRETVGRRTFRFPPRSQPMHAARRSVIAGIDAVESRNGMIPSAEHRDRVAVITFDKIDSSSVRRELTGRYRSAMETVSKLQAVGDKSTTTATETGLRLAEQLLRRRRDGGRARNDSKRVVVLLTDGIPNAYESSDAAINSFVSGGGASEAYNNGRPWLDAALLRVHALEAEGIDVYPVGIGLGADYDFMDRVARLGGTAGASGQSPRGSGDPAEYEAILTDLFRKIIEIPSAKLVQ